MHCYGIMRGVEDIVTHVLLTVRFREAIERGIFFGILRHLDAFCEDVAIERIRQWMQYAGWQL